MHDSVTLNGEKISPDLVRTAENEKVLEIDLETAYKGLQSKLEWNSGVSVDFLLQ